MSEERAALVYLLKRLEEDAAFIRAELAKLDAEPPSKPLPTIRQMILTVLQRTGPYGLTRAEIGDAIKRDYGAAVTTASVSGTLARMRGTDITLRGKVWFLKPAGNMRQPRGTAEVPTHER